MPKPINLKKLRLKLGLRRVEVAEMAGVDVSTLSRWETKGIPSRGAARAFVERLATEAETAQ